MTNAPTGVTRSTTETEDVFVYLNADHRRIQYLISQILDINLQAVQQRFFEDLSAELRLHYAAKDRVFYPALIEAATRQQAGLDFAMPARGYDVIMDRLEQLSQEGVTSPKWMLLFGELKQAVESQAEDEEARIFPAARPLLTPEQLRAMPREMDLFKRNYMTMHGLTLAHVSDS